MTATIEDVQPGSGMPRAGAVAHANFETRDYSFFERVYMGAIDGALWSAGALLRLGGRPLKEGLCTVLGALGRVLLAGKVGVARRNLDLAFGDTISADEKERIIRALFRHFVRLGLDFIFDWVYWPPEKLGELVQVEGLEKLEEGLAHGRGFLCVSGHLGNWEIMCASAAAHGYDFFGVFKRPRSPWADRFIGRKRVRYGMNLVEAPRIPDETPKDQRPSIRPTIESIWRSGRAVAYLCDQRPRSGGLLLPFLGVPGTPTSAGLIRYAVANRVPLSYHHCVYEPDGTLRWVIEGPEIIEEQGTEEETTAYYVARVNDWLSRKIKEYPEQWTWGHRRFSLEHYPRRKTDTDPVREEISHGGPEG